MKIGVLMGGRSPEREISIKTGTNISAGLERLGHQVARIDAGENVVEDMKKENIELAFIALHGPLGEDGTIQGLCEFLNIPYTGAGVMSSALCMNKVMTKRVIRQAGILTPDYYCIYPETLRAEEPEREIRRIAESAGVDLPVVVKPSIGGSTIATTIVRDEKDLLPAIIEASGYCNEVIAEKFIKGVEITVGVLGGENPFPLPTLEIEAEGGFYNYYTKYAPGKSTHIIPARIGDKLNRKAQELAVAVFRAVHCYGMGRVDFIVTGDDLYCLEINTIPGMTETSLLPESAGVNGITFEELLGMQIKFAMERHEKMQEVCFV